MLLNCCAFPAQPYALVEFHSIGSLNEFERWVGFFKQENQLPIPSRFVHFNPNERHQQMNNHFLKASFTVDSPAFDISHLKTCQSVLLLSSLH